MMVLDYLVALLPRRSGSGPSDPDGRRPDLEPPPEVRVLELLEDNEGAVWQGDVRTTTGWSAPKTSRVLSELEADGQIQRYRLGRRKLVCLPGEEPEAVLCP